MKILKRALTLGAITTAQNPGRYLKSASWLVLARVTTMTVSLVAMFYIARSLGPRNFGELNYALSVIGIFAVLSGLTGTLFRDIVKKEHPEGVLLGTAWTVSFLQGTITAALVLAYIFLIPHDTLTREVIGIALFSLFFSPFSILQNIFYAESDTKWFSASQVAVHVIISLAKITAMTLGKGVLVLAMLFVLETALSAMFHSILYLKRRGAFSEWRFKPSYARQLTRDSLPLVALAASGAISARVDQLLLKHFMDTTVVGFYSVAVQLSESWQPIAGLALTAFFPAVINSRGIKKIYRQRILTLGAALLCAGLSIAVLTTLLAPHIIHLLYGNAFTPSVLLLRIYIWSLPSMILGFLVTNFLVAENFRQIQIVVGVVPMLINVLLNIILIPIYGAPGAAFATVISYAILPILPFSYASVRHILISRQ